MTDLERLAEQLQGLTKHKLNRWETDFCRSLLTRIRDGKPITSKMLGGVTEMLLKYGDGHGDG